jgi:transposase
VAGDYAPWNLTEPSGKLAGFDIDVATEICQRRLDLNPGAMRQRREVVEHPFGTIKMRMGATHFLMRTLPRVSGEMALHVLACNLTRVTNMMGSKPLLTALRASD